ncbi:hypothetical protein GN956_G9997 [Arapaima gigas]
MELGSCSVMSGETSQNRFSLVAPLGEGQWQDSSAECNECKGRGLAVNHSSDGAPVPTEHSALRVSWSRALQQPGLFHCKTPKTPGGGSRYHFCTMFCN